jgi:hypothetical protein
MIKISPTKTYKIPYIEDGEEKFSMTWKFPCTTDKEVLSLKRIEDKEAREEAFEELLINSLIGIDGFVDEVTNQPILLSVENKRAFFDYVKGTPEYHLEVISSFLGPNAKNLLVGAMRQLTQNGKSLDATNANVNVEKEQDIALTSVIQ